MTDPEPPDTNALEIALAWLDAFNSGDGDRVRACQETYAPGHPGYVERTLSMRHMTGGFDLLRVEVEEPEHVEVLVKGRGDGVFARLSADTGGTADSGTADSGTADSGPRVWAVAVPRPADQPAPGRLSFGGVVDALDGAARQGAAEDRFAGAVLVGRDGRVEFQAAYGLADRQAGEPNTVGTRFRVGSMNKMFTATAVLRLAGEARIDLAAPVARYLPDYPNQELASKVTVRHLLTHTGGTGDIFTDEYFARRLEVREPRDYVGLYGHRDLGFEPGSTFSYSNYGFLLLGVIVESVSGISYYDYVDEHVFRPAGMRDTDSLPESDNVPNLAVGYHRRGAEWADNADTLPWRGTPAGGGYSTVGDLFRFAEALSRGRLIGDELLAEMTTAQPGTSYGFGMEVSEGPTGRRFGHGGGAPGMNGVLRVYPAAGTGLAGTVVSGTVVAVLSNLDPPVASRLADFFEDRMPVA